MRISTRLGLSLAAVFCLTAGASSAAEARCVEGNCWMICEEEFQRCQAQDDGSAIGGPGDCFERYQACTLECPM